MRVNKALALQILAIFASLTLAASLATSGKAFASHPPVAESTTYNPCNCVIFRFDDVTDYWAWKVTARILDEFKAQNEDLSVAIVVKNIGANKQIVSRIVDGVNRDKFEVGIHGWEHVNHKDLDRSTQIDHFKKSKDKLVSLFRVNALEIFAAPFNGYNSDTFVAMKENNLHVFSTARYAENKVGQTSSQGFTNIYKVDNSFNSGNAIIELSNVDGSGIYHAPLGFSIMQLQKGGFTSGANGTLVNEALARIDREISTYGFAMVALHQADFQKIVDGQKFNEVDETKFSDLVQIIDKLQEKGTPMKKIMVVVPADSGVPVHRGTLLTLDTVKSVPWGKDITVTGRLIISDGSGTGIANATIRFDGTGAANLTSVVTNADGTFIAKGASPSTVASGWKVQAHFDGTPEHFVSHSAIKYYSTFKHSVSLTLFSKTAGAPWGLPTTFTALLKDSSTGNTPISGKVIRFDGTGVANNIEGVTNSDGKAVATATAPATVSADWTYQAHFAGDSLYNAKDSVVKTYSTIKHNTVLSLSVSPSTVPAGGSYTVTTTLKDNSAKVPLAGKTVTFTADPPIIITDQVTDSQGKGKTTLQAPLLAGTYNIQAHFASEDLYNAADSTVQTLTVESATVTTATTEPSSSDALQSMDTTANEDSGTTNNTKNIRPGEARAPQGPNEHSENAENNISASEGEASVPHSDSTAGNATDATLAENDNKPPKANAGKDQTVIFQSDSNETAQNSIEVSLNGTESTDPDGDELKFSWKQTDGPKVKLEGKDTATPTFELEPSVLNVLDEIDDKSRTFTFVLTVIDKEGKKDQDNVDVQVIVE